MKTLHYNILYFVRRHWTKSNQQAIRRNSTNVSLLMFELCSLLCLKALFTEFCNCACAKKIVILIRIHRTCVALLHKKTILSLETSSEINFEFIKFVKTGKCFPFTKTNREYYINSTFPDWVIVENIIPRNLIITFPEMIVSIITQSENVICILLYRILDPLFSVV